MNTKKQFGEHKAHESKNASDMNRLRRPRRSDSGALHNGNDTPKGDCCDAIFNCVVDVIQASISGTYRD